MTRRRVSRDLNHNEIMHALRDCGVHVFDASAVGDGFPDLVCSRHGIDGERGMNANQERFSEAWRLCGLLSAILGTEKDGGMCDPYFL